ncbi:MAG: hemolysin family protein [Planctomycetota bacterium]
MTAIILVAGLTLATSFLCSLLEAALYSLTPAQLEVAKKNGVFGARRFAIYREHVEEPIAAILAVNTVANTFGASVAGALVGDHFGNAAIGWFAGVFTFLVLVFSEIIPKSLGVRYAARLVPLLVLPLQVILWISWPVARPARFLMSKLTGSGEAAGPTEDEIIALSRMAARGGVLTSSEMLWVENALGLDKVSARDLMTPRTVVYSVAIDQTVGALADTLRLMRHSRLPVYEGEDHDKIIGVIYRRELYDAVADGTMDRPLAELVRPLEFVPDSMKGPQLLEKFIRGKRHMVAVIDEYGGFEGIVTLEDVLECLLGQEIVDEHDEHVDMQELARRRARVLRGRRAGRSGESADRTAVSSTERGR